MTNIAHAGTDGNHRPPDSAEPGAEEEMERVEFVGSYDDSWDIDWEDEWRVCICITLLKIAKA
ncbi:hypothetical protein AB4238_17695 [Shewanella sp. 10N.286.45.A1]|uniref:hypothetical protein n=1 Tax=Shewanella sp. 10N.286.45.A1 TaxID=3229694 RepID=UPI003550D875